MSELPTWVRRTPLDCGRFRCSDGKGNFSNVDALSGPNYQSRKERV